MSKILYNSIRGNFNFVIAGGSFSAFYAIKILSTEVFPYLWARQPQMTSITLTIVTPNKETYWNIAAMRVIADIETLNKRSNEIFFNLEETIRKYFPVDGKKNILNIIQGKVVAVNPYENQIKYLALQDDGMTPLDHDFFGQTLPYDQLLLATGTSSSSAAFKLSGSAELTKETLRRLHHQTKNANSIAIVGAGVCGIELAGELAYKYGKSKKITLYGGINVVDGLKPKLTAKALKMLEALNVKCVTDTSIIAINSEKVFNPIPVEPHNQQQQHQPHIQQRDFFNPEPTTPSPTQEIEATLFTKPNSSDGIGIPINPEERDHVETLIQSYGNLNLNEKISPVRSDFLRTKASTSAFSCRSFNLPPLPKPPQLTTSLTSSTSSVSRSLYSTTTNSTKDSGYSSNDFNVSNNQSLNYQVKGDFDDSEAENSHQNNDYATPKKILTLKDGSQAIVDLCISTTGNTPNSSYMPFTCLDNNGYIITDEYLRMLYENPFSNIYVAGDLAACTRETMVDIHASQVKTLKATFLHDFIDDRVALRKYKKSAPTYLVPISKKGGIGTILGMAVPQFFVTWIKSKDFMIGTAPKYLT